jgi:hypothetical protein
MRQMANLHWMSYEALFKGGEHGSALTSGAAVSSRIIQYMRGTLQPLMPPEEEAQPSKLTLT